MHRPPTLGRFAPVLALVVGACGGGLGYRSVAEIAGDLPVPPGVQRIRLEIENGTLDIAAPEDPAPVGITYRGGVRRAANTAADLERIEAQPIALEAAVDDADPAVLVVRGPRLPEGVAGVIGFEAGIRVPAEMPLEVVVRANGHVTMVGRRAHSRVRTGRGDLRFERCEGGVEARTGQGVLIAFGHRGDLDVRSDNGDMQAFVEVPGESITLDTGRGTVQCHVPESLAFEVDARVEVGKIGSGYDLPVATVGEFRAAMVGRRSAGTTRIVLRSAKGHLALIPRKFD